MPTEDTPVTEPISETPHQPINRTVPDPSPEIAESSGVSEPSETAPRFELSTFLLLVICVVLAIYTLYFGRAVIIPLMVALLLKLVLSPVVRALYLCASPNGPALRWS
jgi:hypothetical protein